MRDNAEGTVLQMQQQIEDLQNQLDAAGQKPNITMDGVYGEGSKARMSATAYANGEVVLAKGFCWSTYYTEPTISNGNYILVDTNSNYFTALTSSNLTAGTTYYIRAFATNSNGTAYSSVITYTHSITVPVSGTSTYNVTGDTWIYDAGGPTNSYRYGSNGTLCLTCNSGYQIMIDTCIYDIENNWDKLYIYSGNYCSNDTVSLLQTLTGSGNNTVTSIYPYNGVSGMSLMFTSDNSVQYSGFAIKVKLVPMCPATVSDHQNNSYTTVRVGDKCWMRESMRCTTYPSGVNITLVSFTNGTSSSYYSTTNAYNYYPGNSYATDHYGGNTITTYGYLYNWTATSAGTAIADNMRGICPSGWHLPNYTELQSLKNIYSDIYNSNGFNLTKAGIRNNSNAFVGFGDYAWLWGTNGSSPALYRSDNNSTNYKQRPTE